MTKPLYEQCWRRHRAVGTLGYPSIEEIRENPLVGHMSVVTCGRDACVRSANRVIREVTGHDGVFRPFSRRLGVAS